MITYAIVIDNTGNVTLTGVSVTDQVEAYGATSAVYVSGDLNGNGQLEVNETWTFAATYVLTQADLDGRGGGNDLLDNTGTGDTEETPPDSDTETVPLVYNPDFTVLKEVTSIDDGADFGGTGQADSAGDVIRYAITVANTGNITLTGFSYIDQNADGDTITYASGDSDSDGDLDVGETWLFSAAHTVTQAELDGRGSDIAGAIDGDGYVDNRVTVDFTELGPRSSTVQTPLVWTPGIDVEKYVQVDSGSGYGAWEDADNPRGPETNVNTAVNFRVVISNTGNATLTGIHLGDLLYNYANDTASAISYGAAGAWVDLDNDGNLDSGEEWTALDTNNDGTLDSTSLAVGGSLSIYYSLPFAEGQHTNTVTVTTTEGVTDTDAANYYGLPTVTGPGVRTPGFWSRWTNLWDGNEANDPHQTGTVGFPEHDVLYAVDSNNDGFVNSIAGDGINDDRPLDAAGLLIGDFDRNGIRDPGEDVIFISLNDALNLVDASKKSAGNDGVQILGRDLVAAWLNYLAGNGIGDAGDDHSPLHFIQDAVDFLQTFGGMTNGGLTEIFDVYNPGHSVVRTSSGNWQNVLGALDLDHSGSQMHTALDTYNNTGTIDGTWYAGSADDPTFLLALSQVQTP